jgi:folate-binding protein YgfZ
MHNLSGRLSHLGTLRFTGPDGIGFLQGQVSNDTRRLSAGQTLLAAYSTNQGRVLAVLHLLPHSTGLIAILPHELVAPIAQRLRKFVLRAKVTIEDASEALVVAGQHGAQGIDGGGLAVPQAPHSYAETHGIGVGRVPGDANRYWVIGDLAQLADAGLAGAPHDAAQIERAWRRADIRAGLPQVYATTQELFVAQMLNLDLIDGISFSKGCFTGQEIIARTQHLGRIKRRLFRLRLPDGLWRVGQTLRLSDGRTGRITELVRDPDACEALAVLNIDAKATADGGDGADAGIAVNAVKNGEAVNPGEVVNADGAGAAVDAVLLPLPYDLGGGA